MILDVHADIVHGKKQQVLLDVARGAYAAGMKVNITTASNVEGWDGEGCYVPTCRINMKLDIPYRPTNKRELYCPMAG